MLNEETRRKLKELNINELAVALEQQQKDPLAAKLSFDERFQRLVDYLYQEKYNFFLLKPMIIISCLYC